MLLEKGDNNFTLTANSYMFYSKGENSSTKIMFPGSINTTHYLYLLSFNGHGEAGANPN